jgi:hypothetical protein
LDTLLKPFHAKAMQEAKNVAGTADQIAAAILEIDDRVKQAANERAELQRPARSLKA